MTKQRSLYFGGSFNPIHVAHLICARQVAEAAGFDRVILIPSGQSPHKIGNAAMALPIQRLAMCRLAVAGDSLFEVDDIEVNRSGPSYTIETALALRQRQTEKIAWLVGADMAVLLPHWHQPDRLLTEVNFYLMARPGWQLNWNLMPAGHQHLKQRVIPTPQLDISSSAIRQRLGQNLSIQYLTPDPVIQYIEQNHLYKDRSK